MQNGLQSHSTSDPFGTRDLSTWSVWRQDDSGNRFLVEANLTEAQAKSLTAELEARGQKQMYWSSDERISVVEKLSPTMRHPDAQTTSKAILAIVETYISEPPLPHRNSTAPPVPHGTTDIDRVRRDFLNSFFDGYTSPRNQIVMAPDARYYGFLAGQDFRSRGLAPEEEVMRSFGFEPVSMTGQLFFGQGSGFTPMENPNVRWGFNLIESEGWPAKSERKNGLKAVLTGYLGPESCYGTRWLGDRTIFVIKTEVLGE